MRNDFTVLGFSMMMRAVGESLTTKQDKGENDVVCMLVYRSGVSYSFCSGLFSSRAMVSMTWCQPSGSKTTAGCSRHRSSHLVLVSSSRRRFVACHCHDVGGRLGSAIGSPYRLTVNHCNNTNGRGKAISVDRFKTEMVVCTDGRCVGIFVVHPDGPIFLRAGRRPYQQSLPTRHTSTTHFTSQTVRNVCKYGRQGCRHPVPTTVYRLTKGFAERRGTVGLGPVVEQ